MKARHDRRVRPHALALVVVLLASLATKTCTFTLNGHATVTANMQ